MSTSEANDPRVIRRLTQRETRSSRAALSIVVASVLLVAMVWLALELVLSATGNTALLMSPVELAERTASLATETIPGALVAAGVALGLLGLAMLASAFLPGTRSRHIIVNGRSAVVVDSEVLAAAVSRAARTAARLAPEQVTSRVGHKRIDVQIHPNSGMEVNTGVIEEAVERELSGYGLRRPLAVAVSTGTHGAVGA